jgi:hypothetical protein
VGTERLRETLAPLSLSLSLSLALSDFTTKAQKNSSKVTERFSLTLQFVIPSLSE